jgi:predicted dehydrogenase
MPSNLIGDQRKYLAALVTLKAVMDPDNEPTDQLTEDAARTIAEAGSSATTVSQALSDPKVVDMVDIAIKDFNTRAISRA